MTAADDGDDVIEKTSPDEAFSDIDEQWSPRIAAELNGQAVKLAEVEGEFVVVPSGVEHRPVADAPTRLLLFEPAGTTNTGNVTSDRATEAERLE